MPATRTSPGTLPSSQHQSALRGRFRPFLGGSNASFCISCKRSESLAKLLRLPCRHGIYPQCYAKGQHHGRCPKCAEPVRYKFCGHGAMPAYILRTPAAIDEFEGVCAPCGGTREGRRRWNDVDRHRPSRKVETIGRSYTDYVLSGRYRLYDGVELSDGADKRPLVRQVRTPTAFPALEAPVCAEGCAAGMRAVLWEAIGRKYSWSGPPELRHNMKAGEVRREITEEYGRRLQDARPAVLAIDMLLGKCRDVAQETEMPSVMQEFQRLEQAWRRLEECWLQLKLFEGEVVDAGGSGFAMRKVGEREKRHEWVTRLQKATNAAVVFCSIPQVVERGNPFVQEAK